MHAYKGTHTCPKHINIYVSQEKKKGSNRYSSYLWVVNNELYFLSFYSFKFYFSLLFPTFLLWSHYPCNYLFICLFVCLFIYLLAVLWLEFRVLNLPVGALLLEPFSQPFFVLVISEIWYHFMPGPAWMRSFICVCIYSWMTGMYHRF
jgi:hypothetical protein